MGLTINCPFCGANCRIRTSEKPSLLTIRARIYCSNCGELRADFVGQLTNIKRAVYVDCPESQHWEKPERELLKEQGKKPLKNTERLQYIQRGEKQPDLFSKEPEKKILTPLERVERRKMFE